MSTIPITAFVKIFLALSTFLGSPCASIQVNPPYTNINNINPPTSPNKKRTNCPTTSGIVFPTNGSYGVPTALDPEHRGVAEATVAQVAAAPNPLVLGFAHTVVHNCAQSVSFEQASPRVEGLTCVPCIQEYVHRRVD